MMGDIARAKGATKVTHDASLSRAKRNQKRISPAEYYDTHGVLKKIVNQDVELGLDDALKEDILNRKRKRNLKNITTKTGCLFQNIDKKLSIGKR